MQFVKGDDPGQGNTFRQEILKIKTNKIISRILEMEILTSISGICGREPLFDCSDPTRLFCSLEKSPLWLK